MFNDGGEQQLFVLCLYVNVFEGFLVYLLSDFKCMLVQKLLEIVEQLQIFEGVVCVCKQDVIFVLLKVLICYGDGVVVDGVLEILLDGFGFLCVVEVSYLVGLDDIYILFSQICCFNLCIGDYIFGCICFLKDGECYFVLNIVDIINGELIEVLKNKVLFENLIVLFLCCCFILECGNGLLEDIIGCIFDLMVLQGKGQCLFIVLQLKVGKMMMMQQVVIVIIINYLDVYLIVLLIDECLEEVIEMQCIVCGEVISLIFDELVVCYVQVVEMVIECVKCLVEYKKDVVILFDLIICLVWVYNNVVLSLGKVLIGGVDVNVLYCLKCFFGVVCNVEEGGSLIIIVIVLVDIGLKMDEVIYEEFKGIGNSEVYLSCCIVEKCVFLVIDINCFGICCEDLLIELELLQKIWILCKLLYLMDEMVVMEFLLDKMKNIKFNDEFFGLMKC